MGSVCLVGMALVQHLRSWVCILGFPASLFLVLSVPVLSGVCGVPGLWVLSISVSTG